MQTADMLPTLTAYVLPDEAAAYAAARRRALLCAWRWRRERPRMAKNQRRIARALRWEMRRLAERAAT